MVRVIGLLRRKNTILRRILPINFLISSVNGSQEEAIPMIDGIINVCSALVNLWHVIVLFDGHDTTFGGPQLSRQNKVCHGKIMVVHIYKHNKQFLKHNKHFFKRNTELSEHNNFPRKYAANKI